MASSIHNGQGSSEFRPQSNVAPATHSHGHIEPGEIAVGVVIGRASEYFDFFVYALASVLVFPAIFFPFENRLEGTLYAFVIFAFAFLARPVGTVIFMAIQRAYGREVKLTLALFLLGFSTAGIALLPTYDHIGAWAIILLSLLRVGQGVALGGAWDGLPSLLAINAPQNRRGWYAALGQLGAPLGFIIAASLFAYMLADLTTEDFLDWGWRYPFYVAFAINVVALFARLRLVSTPEYAKLLDERELEPAGVVELSRTQGRNIIIGALAALASYALFHLVTVFPLSWARLYSLRAMDDFLITQIIGAVIMALGIVASGLIADRFGRRTVLGSMALLIAILSAFVPTLMNGGEYGQNTFILIGFALLGLSYGQAAGAVTANFQKKYRYTGAALTQDLAWLVGAGFAPLVALGLSAHFGLAYVSFYLLSGAVGSLAALSLNRALEARED
ncbi:MULTISPECIES: MFS transporter [unclassified Herbaspirillum]|uniref:MFS transporter n=1 Tax=unclassified Herbaspirillum TaxID=2624150 RepID=UPI0011515772|nr:MULTISPECIES: MFS transporter [unclassified Herbaspirillum]MBB5393283.1 MFS family permease [Herbaspirillum sp. SJZ102]TQK03968.1 MFS transporter [Herbaspirillum sp. SJZ130]TQK08700.1 MFS transporter [Herbaspirillum sp. SJZ106]TWC71971.1 MFS transporter [Herbaspirillum sp. SJZ099]